MWPRVHIDRVEPEIDAGRFAAKALVGLVCAVEAVIVKDGHDLISADLCVRRPGSASLRRMPMTYDDPSDTYRAGFVPDDLGRWEYTVEAWPDAFGTWRHDLEKRHRAGQDLRSELIEGGALLQRAAKAHERSSSSGKPAGRSPAADALRSAARLLVDSTVSLEARLEAALDPDLAKHARIPLADEEISRHPRWAPIDVERRAAGVGAWYELFPRSFGGSGGRHGTFKDVIGELPRIRDLGFDVVYLPPIHPIGRTHRKGKNNDPVAAPGDVGSPWAIGAEEGGHTAVHPDLGTLADFVHLCKQARGMNLEIALDYALQCSPDHPWVREHPDWFFVRHDGTIRYAENPPKKYQDIYPLNFWCADRQGLWDACRDVFLFWIEKGVRIFRVDNPHTKPLSFWEWVIGDVRRRHPDVVFLAEAFTRPNRMMALAKLGFSQSYTYFTWRNGAAELRAYVESLASRPSRDCLRPNFFANTPDILHEYLQTGGRPAFSIRLILAATLSPVYGIYSGYELCENVAVHEGSEEYDHSEKYELRPRDFSAPGNLDGLIRAINTIRQEHPSLARLDDITFCETDHDSLLAYLKIHEGDQLLVVVNVDPHGLVAGHVDVPAPLLGLDYDRPFEVQDLLTGRRYGWKGGKNYVRLDPNDAVAHVFQLIRPPALEPIE